MLASYSGTLSEYEAKGVLREAGIPVVAEELARSVEEAVEHAEKIGYPVVLKVDSPDVQHKSDIEAVADAHDGDEVKNRYERILENVEEAVPEAEVNGILVEEKLRGVELIVGTSVDPDFGHVLMFGLGGIFVEVLHDVHFRAIPITERDARELIAEMETRGILEGVRGQEPVDTAAIVEVLLGVSELVEAHPEIVELDINPLFVSSEGVTAADALIRVEG